MNRYGFKLAVGVLALAVGGFFVTSTEAVALQTRAASPVRLIASGQGTGGVVVHPQAHEALPAALRPVLYRVLAKDASVAYNLNAKGCAVLSGLTACFNGSGAHFAYGGSPLALHLVAWGRGDTLTAVNPAKPAVSNNRVSYDYGTLAEWWRVLPVGFEQGFTVTKRLGGAGELTLVLAANAKASERGDAIGWDKLRYGQLVVTDAKGKVIPAALKTKGDRILIAVNDVHAVYPLTVDPLVWLEQKVTASDGQTEDNFGWSVAISGTTAIVGAQSATVNGNFAQGAAYVFSESNGSWTQTAKLTASDGEQDDQFGHSVSLDGTTALVGAPYATVNGNLYDAGKTYVFNESNGTWNQTQELTASDGTTGDQFGWSVALDGTTSLIGAQGRNSIQGAAYVFTESNGNWSQTQEITASDGVAGDHFGFSAALSSDGTTALVGAPYHNSSEGAAYVFTESNGTWSQMQELTASDGTANEDFGWSVSVNDSTALIGATGYNDFRGAAYAFNQSNGTWSQTQELTVSNGTPNDQFGYSVALSSDSTTAVVGAGQATVNGNAGQGAAYVFSNTGGTWSQAQKLTASDGAAHDGFGVSVALPGTTALVGAFNATVNGNIAQGAAYFFGQSDLGLDVSAPQWASPGQEYTSQTIATNNASASSPAVTATITVPAAASFISATPTQGSCNEASGVVSCDFGSIPANAGTAMANVTLKVTGALGTTIDNTASVALATPALTASAATAISICAPGYTGYQGSLSPGLTAGIPPYHAAAGTENAVLLVAPSGFRLALLLKDANGQKIYVFPGNAVHRWGPAGTYRWLVQARSGSGAFTLCLNHP